MMRYLWFVLAVLAFILVQVAPGFARGMGEGLATIALLVVTLWVLGVFKR